MFWDKKFFFNPDYTYNIYNQIYIIKIYIVTLNL